MQPSVVDVQTEPDIEKTVELPARKSVRSVAITGLFLLGCFYTLYFAQDFFIPVVLALVFNFLLSPLVRTLKRLWIPEAAGAALVIVAAGTLIGFVIYEFSTPIAVWIERAPQILTKVQNGLNQLGKPIEKVREAGEQIGKITDGTPDGGSKPTRVEVMRPGLINSLFNKTRDALFGLMVLIVLLYFLLSSGDLFLRKLIHVLPKFEDKKRAVRILRDIEDTISKYLITVALINACLGICAGLLFWMLGMPNPALWGALAFVLNFIPYLGSLTTIAVTGMVAVATFSSLGHALLVPAVYLALASLEGAVISPIVLGRRMTLNPVVIFIGITFWGFLWGIFGIFLAVPTLVMFKIFCDHIEPLASIGEFLGS